MTIIRAIVWACMAFIAALFISNIIAGLQAQAHGVATHQENINDL